MKQLLTIGGALSLSIGSVAHAQDIPAEYQQVAGDMAMLAAEIQPVLRALRKNGIDVVAIHHHMTDTQPTIYFLHYWGTGPAEKLATGFKAALSETGKAKAPAATKQ